MIKISILLLPLIGGYLFLSNFHWTKYWHQRIERQKLIFHSFIAAILPSVIGILIYDLIREVSPEFLVNSVHDSLPDDKALKHSILILFLGLPLAWLGNLFSWLGGIIARKQKDYILQWAIRRYGSPLENEFLTSAKKGFHNDLLMVNLKSNKVYIGYVRSIPQEVGVESISFIPLYGGHRDATTQEFIQTDDYSHLVKSTQKENLKLHHIFGITLLITEIAWVAKFNVQLNIAFQKAFNE